MDYRIELLSEDYLRKYIELFIEILKDERFEYWHVDNFLIPKPKKYDLSLVVSLKSELIGYIIASQKENYAYIHKFMISKRFRSNRIGSKLLHEFEKNVLLNNLAKIRLAVIKENKRATSFYLKNNYEAVESRIDSKNNIELIILQKNIKW